MLMISKDRTKQLLDPPKKVKAHIKRMERHRMTARTEDFSAFQNLPIGRSVTSGVNPSSAITAAIAHPKTGRTVAAALAALASDRAAHLIGALSGSELAPEPVFLQPELTDDLGDFRITSPGRCLIGPDYYPDDTLVAYVRELSSTALGRVPTDRYHSVSPVTAQYLLGAVPLSRLCKLIDRLFSVLGLQIPPVSYRHTSNALCITGCGPNAFYDYRIPDPRLAEDFARKEHFMHGEAFFRESNEDFRKRITEGQPLRVMPERRNPVSNWYESITGQPLSYMLDKGAMQVAHYNKVTHHLPAIVLNYYAQLNFCNEDIGRELKNRCGTWELPKLESLMVEKALKAVFRDPWSQLDLEGDPMNDFPVVLARSVIQALTGNAARFNPPALQAQYLLGLALLTGVPVTSFLRFGRDELVRTGMSFCDKETCIAMVDLLEECSFSDATPVSCEAELEIVTHEFELAEQRSGVMEAKAFARMLRCSKNLLWSRKSSNVYHIDRFSSDGLTPVYLTGFRPSRKLFQLADPGTDADFED